MNFLDLDGNLFPPEKIFCPNTGDEKKSGNFSLKIIFKAKFFFFLEKDIFKFHLQILENPKNFMISFFIPLGLNGVVGNEIWRASSFSHPQRFVGKKV